jgi:hypothetical protein
MVAVQGEEMKHGVHQAQLDELEIAIANATVETGQGANHIRSLK